MKKFVNYNLPELVQVNTESGRFYETPKGDRYPSVTSILSSIPNAHLEKWKSAVGEEEASRIAKSAAARGTRVHECAENYILGKPNKFSMFEHDTEDMFINLIPYLDQFDIIHALEDRLYSDKLTVAGTVDCIAEIKGIKYLVDFKTSARFKSSEEISSYYLQCACYSFCFYERTGVVVPNIRVLITTENDGVLCYDAKVSDWIGKFITLRNSML